MAEPPARVLTLRELNRATLERQLLLARAKLAPVAAVARLVALQAQLPGPPYVGLLARVAGFARAGLADPLGARTLVRGTLLRGTLHTATADDFAALRPVIQPVLTRGAATVLKGRIAAAEIPALCAAVRDFLGDGAQTFTVLRDHLVKLYPKLDERAMGYAVRMHLPLVQVPAPGAWGYPQDAAFALADAWLGRAVATDGGDPRELVRRYLAAFGPASVRDAQTWSGLTGLGPTFEALRPELVAYRAEDGRELFDIAGMRIPPGEIQAPVRFLPEYDNLLLGHAVRTRVVAEAHKPKVYLSALRVRSVVLVDGFARAGWKVERTKKGATLVVEPFAPLAKKERDAVAAEGEGVARFVAPDAGAYDTKFAKG